MILAPSSSALHVHAPLPSGSTTNTPKTPTAVTIHPVALFSILDHFLRRKEEEDRVLGTLLGTRTESGIDVRSSFAVLHKETAEQVAVDMDYHRTMYDLHHKVNPKEVIVGWYSTGSDLNSFSALIQNFYGQETAPHQAIHVTLNTGVDAGEKAGVKAYYSSPVGVYPRPENCVFVPLPVKLEFQDAERSGLDLLKSTATAASASSSQPIGDLDVLESAIHNISDMLDRVLGYVRSVLSGETKGDPALGRYLMDTLGTSVEDGSFHSSLQDTLMISYLGGLVQAQAEVSARLALVSA